METKNIICTACPRGCRLSVKIEGKNISVTGNKCPKGLSYGKAEAVCPMRILTSTIASSVEGFPRLPVKTSKEVPLKNFAEYMHLIRKLKADSSKSPGDIIVKNFAESGADLISAGGSQ
ncbi:DUF1667 domain-containing protein [Treponema sp. OMZ 792]|uniref:DUF1667 domain-containing protein n=1 Tax=unclassified Treponema TaxID=2638727 RepID=UPI0020A5BD37|nr:MULTISPECIES: DUF1667 domain-containing protein [unclassified Treponema]UTC75014.1 DUF1667 domain-containing protein [Treponema sp. OMZ 792]UTC81409.1 DUF1667 domain-containing protein [Treponema sp. OMZ 798]